MGQKKKEVDAKGIPLKASHPAVGMGIPIPMFYAIILTVFGSIGFSIAYFGIYANTPGADSKIETLASLGLGWTYLGVWVLKLCQHITGINLGMARAGSKVNVPDQHVYKVQGAEGSKLGYVLMDQDGAHGKFNRAQRAVQNYNETFPLFALMFLLASFVFPFAAFVTVCISSGFKVLSALGYTASAEGRMPGQMGSMIANTTMEGMVLLAGCKAVGVM